MSFICNIFGKDYSVYSFLGKKSPITQCLQKKRRFPNRTTNQCCVLNYIHDARILR